MLFINKKNTPFLFLLLISSFWAFYYLSSNAFNDYGVEKSEWFLLIDGLIVLPLLCFWCIKNKKEAAIKAIAYCCLVVLLGSFIIPESSKLIWHYLEAGRYVVLAAFIVLELTTVITVIVAIRASLSNKEDPDVAISSPIENILGKGSVSALLSFEARVWTYALFSKKIVKQHFLGDMHFSSHMKDGAQSNQLGFLMIILFELPIMHILLHYTWSPFAANVITFLTLFSLVFFVAEYKALAIRPISITPDSLIVRYGIWNPVSVDLFDIKHIKMNSEYVSRAKNIRRFNVSGNPNVEIKTHDGDLIYLGVDAPFELVTEIKKRIS